MGVNVMARDYPQDISHARQYLDYQANAEVWDAVDEFRDCCQDRDACTSSVRSAPG